MIPLIQKNIDFWNGQLVVEKERMKKVFGSDNFGDVFKKLIDEKALNPDINKILTDYDERIFKYQMDIFKYQSELLYRGQYGFNKYIFEIFHKKFFDIDEHSKYINQNNK